MRLTCLLDDLCCSGCGTLGALWLDPVRGLVECHECGQKASVLVDSLDSSDVLGGDW